MDTSSATTVTEVKPWVRRVVAAERKPVVRGRGSMRLPRETPLPGSAGGSIPELFRGEVG